MTGYKKSISGFVIIFLMFLISSGYAYVKPRKLTEEAKAKMIDIDDFIPEGNWDVVNTGANWSPANHIPTGVPVRQVRRGKHSRQAIDNEYQAHVDYGCLNNNSIMDHGLQPVYCYDNELILAQVGPTLDELRNDKLTLKEVRHLMSMALETLRFIHEKHKRTHGFPRLSTFALGLVDDKFVSDYASFPVQFTRKSRLYLINHRNGELCTIKDGEYVIHPQAGPKEEILFASLARLMDQRVQPVDELQEVGFVFAALLAESFYWNPNVIGSNVHGLRENTKGFNDAHLEIKKNLDIEIMFQKLLNEKNDKGEIVKLFSEYFDALNLPSAHAPPHEKLQRIVLGKADKGKRKQSIGNVGASR